MEVLEFLFDPSAIRDVPGDLRRADDRARGVADRRDGQRDRDERAVLAPANGVEVVDALAAPDVRQDHVLFAKAIGRDQHGDRLTDRPRRPCTEQLFCAAVPGGDDAVEILADDGVV